MARPFFTLALMAAAAAAAGAAEEARACADRLVCLLPASPEYRAQLHNMSRALSDNWGLVEAQQGAPDDAHGHSPDDGDEDNCRQRTTVVRPYMIQTYDSSTHHVVQLQNFEQKVKWTDCLDGERQSCFASVLGDVANTETRCMVKYSAVSLYVYDPQRQKLLYETFPMAVGCACRFKCNAL